MTGKEVFVESYVRSDGTEVKAHYRSAPGGTGNNLGIAAENQESIVEQDPWELGGVLHSSEVAVTESQTGDNELLPIIQIPMPEPEQEPEVLSDEYPQTEMPPRDMFVKGYVSYDEPNDMEPDTAPQIEQNETIQNEIEIEVGNISRAIQQMRIELPTSIRHNTQQRTVAEAISKLEKIHQKSMEIEETFLDEIVKPENKAKYSDMYKVYSVQQATNKNNTEVLNRIKYSMENKQYEDVLNELNNYKSNFWDVVFRNIKERPLKPVIYSNNGNKFNIFDNINPIKKIIIDVGTWGENFTKHSGHIHDAKEMWKASSHDFLLSSRYISKNKSLIYSIEEIPDVKLKQVVNEKIAKANMKDSIGIIYKSNSSLSEQMVKSPEMKNLFQDNKNELLNNIVVKNKSINYQKNKNLNYSIRRAEVPYLFINEKDEFCTIQVDFYDFDKTENNILRNAAIAQEAQLARKYYSIHITKVPKSVWQKWLN